MDEETFKLIYQRAREFFRLCGHVDALDIEVLGGEISRMPYEFWEKMLPFAIDQHEKFSDEFGIFTDLYWCTNMIIQDRRYIDLFNEHKNTKWWAIYSSWEPDTGRFGKNDKLYPRFIKTAKEVEKSKTLNLVPSKGLIATPFEKVIEVMTDGGFSDISSNMLFPYGSGEAFFNENQPTFEAVSDFYIHMSKEINKIPGLTASPWEEVVGSLVAGEGFNLNGNNVFDATIEPDGTVSMSSPMTGSQSLQPAKTLHVSDPLLALKLLFENSKAMHVRFNLEQKECDQCEFLRYCNGGYYYYKHLTEDVMSKYDQNDCSGYKKFWSWAAEELKDQRYCISEKNHNNSRLEIRARVIKEVELIEIKESEISSDYQSFFETFSGLDYESSLIVIDRDRLFSLSVIERLWFYDSIGVKVKFDESIINSMSLDDAYRISRNIIAKNYKSISVHANFVWDFIESFPTGLLARRVIESIRLMSMNINVIGSNGTEPSVMPSGLVVDERNDELFRFVLSEDIPESVLKLSDSLPDLVVGGISINYIEKVKRHMDIESILLKSKGVYA